MAAVDFSQEWLALPINWNFCGANDALAAVPMKNVALDLLTGTVDRPRLFDKAELEVPIMCHCKFNAVLATESIVVEQWNVLHFDHANC